MKKFILLSFVSFIIFTANAVAGVTFIVDSPQHTSIQSVPRNNHTPSNPSLNADSSAKCTQSGYTKTSCGEGKYPVERCPYNSSYFKYCCANAYTNDHSQCE